MSTDLKSSDHPLSGFRFADLISRGRAVLAAGAPRPSAYLIVGPPMSGKTRLARRILASMYGVLDVEVRARSTPPTEAAWQRMLWLALTEGYLFIDDLNLQWRGRGRNRVPEVPDTLLAFLTSPEWTGRLHHTTEIKTVANSCVTFLTCSDESQVPADLLRRVRLIRLTTEGAA